MIPGAITASEFEVGGRCWLLDGWIETINQGPGGLAQSRIDSFRDCTVVPYCTIGFRSGLYARQLIAKHELQRVSNLHGSILAWTHHQLPLECEGRPTTHVHVFSKDWTLQASGYDAVFYERAPVWRMLGFAWSSFWARRDP